MAEETKDTSVVEVEKEQVDTQEETATAEKTFTQAELDAIIQKEKAKAKRSAEREYKEKMDEADKLRKMNADQKAAYEAQKQADRIALVTRIRLLLIADGHTMVKSFYRLLKVFLSIFFQKIMIEWSR